jgi:ketosteroid isomerase-like protein
MTDKAWEQTPAHLETALRSFVRGDPTGYKALWSHQDDVTIFGSFGGLERGWVQVGLRLDWASEQYSEGECTVEYVTTLGGTDVAYTVHLERTRARLGRSTEESVREQRVTHVFRREADRWRIVHLHVDPLMHKQAPE